MTELNPRAAPRLETITHTWRLDHPPNSATKRRSGGRQWMEVTDIATNGHITRATLCALLVHHGYLELAPYGGTQQRHLLTRQAVAAGLGTNVRPISRRQRGRHHAKAAPFPVFYRDAIDAILWTLDYEGLTATAAIVAEKRKRAKWLLMHWGFLPRQELARLSGYSEWGWTKLTRSCSASHNIPDEAAMPTDGYLTAWLKTAELLRKS
jgi:hypothetical protein